MDVDAFLQFVALVQKMRTNQKAYFKTRDRAYLIESKNIEKQVDTFIAEHTESLEHGR